MRRIWKIALSVAILMFWISFFALAWLVVGVFVFSIVTAQLLSCAAAPWLFAAAAILVVGGLVAACWEHGLLRKDFAAFRRLSASRRCVLTAFVVLAAYSAGTKGDGGRSNGAADAPRLFR